MSFCLSVIINIRATQKNSQFLLNFALRYTQMLEKLMLLRKIILLCLVCGFYMPSLNAQHAAQHRVSTSPKIVKLHPAQASTNVPIASQLIIQFDRPIQTGSGNLIIQKEQGNTPVQIIEASSIHVNADHNRLVVDLNMPLAHYTTYHIQIDKNYVKDLEGNAFAGTPTVKNWHFTTKKPTEQKSLHVFPTPATDYFNVQLKGVQIKVARIELYSSKGELVKVQLLKPSKNNMLEQKIWIRDLPEDIYILRVITPNYLMEKRVPKRY